VIRESSLCNGARRLSNHIAVNDTTGRLTYGNGEGGTQLLTMEHTRRGVAARLHEQEQRIRVRVGPERFVPWDQTVSVSERMSISAEAGLGRSSDFGLSRCAPIAMPDGEPEL
jgi:hypothetical protein